MKIKIIVILAVILLLSCSEGDNLPMPNNPFEGSEGKITISISPDPYPAGTVNLLVKWILKETGGVDVNIDSIISNVYDPSGELNTGYSDKFKDQLDISQLFSTYQIYGNDSVSTVFNLDYVPISGGRNEVIVYSHDRIRNILHSSAVIDFD